MDTKFFTVKEVQQVLKAFPEDALVLIESSNGEYGPYPVTEIHMHQGEKERYGVDWPPDKKMAGFPVLCVK